MAITFKTTKPTGRYRSFQESHTDIKLDGKIIGTIVPNFKGLLIPAFKIGVIILKSESELEKESNCIWKWVYFKKNF